MYYTIYKITNKINQKIYIGCHKTNDIDDNYMGSGKILMLAQKKYGKENFHKEILEIFDNPEDMFKIESILVNKDFIQRCDTYNLREGGIGGFTKEAGLLGNLRRNWLLEHDEEFRKDYCQKCIANGQQIHRLYPKLKYNFSGKVHTEETKRKIGKANSKHQSGNGNSQYNTCWIYSIEKTISKKIKNEELQCYIDQGWLKGRKMKF